MATNDINCEPTGGKSSYLVIRCDVNASRWCCSLSRCNGHMPKRLNPIPFDGFFPRCFPCSLVACGLHDVRTTGLGFFFWVFSGKHTHSRSRGLRRCLFLVAGNKTQQIYIYILSIFCYITRYFIFLLSK